MTIQNKRVTCPHCGGEILVPTQVSTRQAAGSGTRRGQKLKRLTINHINAILTLERLGRPATVREVQSRLWKDNLGRFTRDDFKKARVDDCHKPSGSWNYHTVQAILSVLVGHGDVSMTSTREKFDDAQGIHDAQPVPHYQVKPGAADRAREALRALSLQAATVKNARR